MSIFYIALIPIILSLALTVLCAVTYRQIIKIIPLILVGVVSLSAFTYLGINDDTSEYIKTDMNFYYNAILSNGATADAIELILEDIENTGETFENILALARAKVFSDDYAAAKGLYGKALALSDESEDFPEDEYYAVMDKVNFSSSDSFANFIEEEWGGDYDYSDLAISDSEEVLTYDEINKLVKNNIDDYVDSVIAYEKTEDLDYYKDLEKAIEAASYINEVYENSIINGNVVLEDEDTIEKYTERIVDAFLLSEDNQSLDFLRANLIKGYILLDEPEKLVEILANGTVYNKILLTELYFNDIVKDNDFSDEEFLTVEEGTYDKVIDRIKEIKRNLEDEIEIETAENAVDALENGQENEILSQLKINLDTNEEEIKESEETEVYFVKAKIDSVLGNDDSADNNLESAMETAEKSENESLAESLIIIKNDLENKDLSDEERIAAVETASSSITQIEIPDKSETDDETIGFDTYLQNYVSMKRASITISNIDADEFTTISATFSIDESIANSADKLKELIEVYDCDEEITDFTLEKIEFNSAYTMLVSDVSGSMSGNETNLKNAITSFADVISPIEKVSVIAFNSNIVFSDPFTSSASDIYASADKISVTGGTNVYGTLVSVLDDFESTSYDTSNVVIIMTDGIDGNSTSRSTIYSTLASLCAENNAIVYTMGLGSDVDADYLSEIARACGGQYMNITNSLSLQEFYVFLHNQLSNQYLITYTAKNEYLNNRELKISLTSTSEQDTKSYTLFDESDMLSTSYDDLYNINQDGVSVSNIDTNTIYQGSNDVRVLLYGNGFESDDIISIKLEGNTSEKLTGVYLSSSVIEFYVPSSMMVGIYDLSIDIDENHFDLENALTIMKAGSESVFRFGEYYYVAGFIEEEDDCTILSGNVIMNNWLKFNGPLMIYGNKDEAYSVVVDDQYGSKITFDLEGSTGLASVFAKWGIQVPLTSFGKHVITRESGNIATQDYEEIYGENYEPSEVYGLTLSVPFVITVEAQGLLYHDRIEFVTTGEIMPLLPEMSTAITINETSLEITAKEEVAIYLSSTTIGLNIDLENSISQDEAAKSDTFFAIIPVVPETFNIKIDTFANDYLLDLKVYLKNLPQAKPSIKLEIEDGKWKEILLGYDTEVSIMIGTVPASFSDFKIGLTDMNAEILSGDLLSALLNSRLTGQMEFAIAKVKAIVPALEFIFEDAALLNVKDITLTAPSFRQLTLDLSARAVLFDAIEVASAEVSIGAMTYTNSLLNLNDMDTSGIRVKLSRGIDLDYNIFGIYVNGTTEALVSTNYTGIQSSGAIDMYIGLDSIDGQGDFILAFYTTNSGKFQFSIIGKVNSDCIRFDWLEGEGISF